MINWVPKTNVFGGYRGHTAAILVSDDIELTLG